MRGLVGNARFPSPPDWATPYPTTTMTTTTMTTTTVSTTPSPSPTTTTEEPTTTTPTTTTATTTPLPLASVFLGNVIFAPGAARDRTPLPRARKRQNLSIHRRLHAA